ncbi:MAG: alkyl hydroperoxide reductase [Gallionellaceae bacterium]|nr:MAG: alkyl hydroperoxide reductase [Gallionellaceae bacterium]
MANLKSYKMLVALAVAGLAIALAIAGLLLSLKDAPKDMFPQPSVAAKEAAPDFKLALLDGSNFQLGSHKGKPVLINFFASWCLPCGEEMPAIEKIVHEYGPRGVVFLGISTDDTETNASNFIKKHGVTFPAGIDKSTEIQKAYGLYGIPTTYFIDKQGMVNYFHSGSVTEDLMRHELDKLL